MCDMNPECFALMVTGCIVVPRCTHWLMGDDFDTCVKSNMTRHIFMLIMQSAWFIVCTHVM